MSELGPTVLGEEGSLMSHARQVVRFRSFLAGSRGVDDFAAKTNERLR
jgi:hypothetical protein